MPVKKEIRLETRGKFKALSAQSVHHPLDTLGLVWV